MSWDDTSEFCDSEQVGDIIECVCQLKKTIECVAECFSGHLSSGTKQKILFCLVLQEIKSLENVINNVSVTINSINEIVAGINDTINNENFGLNEIKNEIKVIENAIFNDDFGLQEIKNEIKGIENAVNNEASFNNISNILNEIINSPLYGLNEIKNEIRLLVNQASEEACLSGILTTGPVMRNVNANSLVVKVLNNSQSNQTVSVKVFNLASCPKNDTLFNELLGPIGACCACDTRVIDLNRSDFEVQISGVVPGIYVWAGAKTGPGPTDNFVDVNTFSHAEFVCQIFNNC